MVIALTPNQTREWSPSSEKDAPADRRTVFILRAVPFSVRAHIAAMLAQGGEAAARTTNITMRVSLAGWRNFRDPAGAEVPFVSETIDVGGSTVKGVPNAETYEQLGALDMKATNELLTECMAGLGLRRDEVLG